MGDKDAGSLARSSCIPADTKAPCISLRRRGACASRVARLAQVCPSTICGSFITNLKESKARPTPKALEHPTHKRLWAPLG